MNYDKYILQKPLLMLVNKNTIIHCLCMLAHSAFVTN